VRKLPVKLTDPVTPILYITADKQHMEELKHAIHVKSIDEGCLSFTLFYFYFLLFLLHHSYVFTVIAILLCHQMSLC